MTDSKQEWYLDSLDARAGIGFGSMRRTWTEDFTQVDERMAVRVAPPDFQVEGLASSTTGLAAARGTFQLGLYLSPKEEVAFPSLPAMVEFIRRLYLRSGGGDPGGEPVPTGSGEPSGGLDLSPPQHQEDEDPVTLLGREIEAFKDACDSMDSTHNAKPYDWHLGKTLDYGKISGAACSRRLARAALRLLWEALQRAPRGASKAEWLSWSAGCIPLVRAIDRLQLWSRLLADHEAMVDVLFRQVMKIAPPPNPAEGVLTLRHLMLTGWATDPHFLSPYYPFGFAAGLLSSSDQSATSFDDLRRIHIPKSVAGDVCPDSKTATATLRHLLVSLLGQPLAPKSGPPVDDAKLELLFFAVNYLAAPMVPSRKQDLIAELVMDDHSTGALGFLDTYTMGLTDKALRWLQRELPRWTYRPEVEEMIRAVNDTVPPFA